jgi:hypothetical protein
MNKLANMRHWSERMGPGFGMSRPNMNMTAITPQHKPVHGSSPILSPTSAETPIHYSFNVPFASDLAGPNVEDILRGGRAMDTPSRRARRRPDLRIASSRPERYESEEAVQRPHGRPSTHRSLCQIVRTQTCQRTSHECVPLRKPGAGPQEQRDHSQRHAAGTGKTRTRCCINTGADTFQAMYSGGC